MTERTSRTPAQRNGARKAEQVVKEATRGAGKHPHETATLHDQRDRTTGADQATRADMHATKPHTLKDTSKAKAPRKAAPARTKATKRTR